MCSVQEYVYGFVNVRNFESKLVSTAIVYTEYCNIIEFPLPLKYQLTSFFNL